MNSITNSVSCYASIAVASLRHVSMRVFLLAVILLAFPDLAQSTIPGRYVWTKVVQADELDIEEFTFCATAFDQSDRVVYGIDASEDPMRVAVVYLDDFSIEYHVVGRPAERIDQFTFDPKRKRLVASRSGRDMVYALDMATLEWRLIGRGSFDSEAYGATFYWNSVNNSPEFFAGYGMLSTKNWVYRSTPDRWVSIVSNNESCEPRKRMGVWPSLGRPGSGTIYFSGGAGNCSGDQRERSCDGGSPWASDMGKWCWLKDLYSYNMQTSTFTPLRPFSDETYVGEGPIAFDYNTQTMYQFPRFRPPHDYPGSPENLTSTQVYAFKLGGQKGYERIKVSGDLPPADQNGQVYYNGNSKNIVLIRPDGIWTLQADAVGTPSSR